MAEEHRYLARVRFLLNKLERILRERGRELELTLLGVEHVGHLFPAEVPALAEADLISLELPTTPVKAYLTPEGASTGDCPIHIRNIFWLDILEHCRRNPPPLGVHGCNVNPHVRYLRGRLYYRHGLVANDYEAPALAIPYPSAAVYSREELGGEGDEAVVVEEIFPALPRALKATYETNRLVHVSAEENPYGPGRHLILFEVPPSEILEVQSYAVERLTPLARELELAPPELSGFVQQQVMEGFLLAVGDFYLVELLLEKLVRAAAAPEAAAHLRAVHVAGIAHLPHLLAYLALAAGERFRVVAAEDPRYPVHGAYLTPPFFARELPQSLAAVSVRKEEVQVDLPHARALIDRYLAEEPDDLHRRLLVKAIWTRDRELKEAAPFRTLAAEIPLDPGCDYADRFSTSLDQNLLKYVTAAQPEPLLTELNARLARGARRGNLATVTQELRELGLGYEQFLAHPQVGPLFRLREELWNVALTRSELHTLLRRAHHLRAGAP